MIKKDYEIERSAELRAIGYSINSIAKELKVSKSSVSCWVRNIEKPERLIKEYRLRIREEGKRLKKEERLKNKKSKKERILSGAGYWMIPIPDGYEGTVYSCGYIYEHRYVLEKKIGRYLKKDEIAHHLNGNTFDNRPENLEIKSRIEHKKIHDRKRKYVKVVCPSCLKLFIKPKNQTPLSKRKGRYVFCSRKCSGIFNRMFVLGRLTIDEKFKNIINEFEINTPVSQLDLESSSTKAEVPSSTLGRSVL